VARGAADAVIVGAGPNGLAAAVAPPRAGRIATALEHDDPILPCPPAQPTAQKAPPAAP